GVIWWRKGHKGKVPNTTVLRLSLEHTPVEDVPEDIIGGLIGAHPPIFRDLLEALERAENDSRVVGLIMDGSAPRGMAQAQELRDAILSFRAKHKFAIAFADSFGEFGPGMKEYFLATAFDQIWLQPSGDIGLTGVMSEVPFLRGSLDKLG